MNTDYKQALKLKQMQLHEDSAFKEQKLGKTRKTLVERHGSVSYPQQRSKEAIKLKYGVNSVF